MSAKNETNAEAVESCSRRVSGIAKHVTESNVTIPVAGKLCTPDEVGAIFQRELDARAHVDSLRAQLGAALLARDQAAAARRDADGSLQSWVTNRFGASSAEAQEIGYPAPKPVTKSVATKAAAVQKCAATRAARHTMGSRQRAAISGVTLVYSSPAAAEAAAAKAAEVQALLPGAPAPAPRDDTPSTGA